MNLNINTVALGYHITEDGLTEGSVELRIYETSAGWRVETTVEPALPQYDDFVSRSEAIAFLKNLIVEVL